MARAELVFMPSPGVGHLVSTIKFVTQFLDRDHRFSATILVMKYPFSPTPTDGISNPPPPTSSTPRIRYLHLPLPPDPPSHQILYQSFEKYYSLYIESHKTLVKNAIMDIDGPVIGLILDLFCTSMIDVGNELGVNSYIFFTSCAGFLGSMFHLETRDRRVGIAFDKSEADSILPCFAHPVPMGVLPQFSFNSDGGFSSMAMHARKFKESKGVIINTFAELEPYAFSSLSEEGIPPIYTVGPVLDLESENRPTPDENQSREIRVWLDNQPPSSVVFLCFGSRGCFSQPQVMEIANGLESSGMRFLWSLRRPPSPDKKFEQPSDYADLDDVLPEGFRERVKGKGRVCGWVRQMDVLAHKAIGGFVSHCGWNSVLESIWHAVPLVAWPLYAEQQINAFELVRELGLAVEMKIDYHRDCGYLLSADQIERTVRCLMDGDDAVEQAPPCRGVGEKSDANFLFFILFILFIFLLLFEMPKRMLKPLERSFFLRLEVTFFKLFFSVVVVICSDAISKSEGSLMGVTKSKSMEL